MTLKPNNSNGLRSLLERRKADHRSKEAERQRILMRSAVNSAKPCVCPSCTTGREGLSIYCPRHRAKYRKHSHPTNELPTQSELVALERVISDWLEDDYLHLSPMLAKPAFIKIWTSALKRLSKPVGYAFPFYQFEGGNDFTSQTKGRVILAWYQHKQKKPLGAAMLRHMALQLYAEFKYTLPPGKTNFVLERQRFVNNLAGRYVLHNSGFARTTNVNEIVGWERPTVISNIESENLWQPITERSTKLISLNVYAKATVAKAAGAEVQDAVEFAMGKLWITQSESLRAAASAALEVFDDQPYPWAPQVAFAKSKREQAAAAA